MQLDVKTGQTVVADVQGHSAINGAPIPTGSVVHFTSNDEAVATVPADLTTTVDGDVLDVPITIVAAGATDIHVTVTAPDGSVFEDTAQLTVGEPIPGLLRVALTLRTVP